MEFHPVEIGYSTPKRRMQAAGSIGDHSIDLASRSGFISASVRVEGTHSDDDRRRTFSVAGKAKGLVTRDANIAGTWGDEQVRLDVVADDDRYLLKGSFAGELIRIPFERHRRGGFQTDGALEPAIALAFGTSSPGFGDNPVLRGSVARYHDAAAFAVALPFVLRNQSGRAMNPAWIG